MISSIIGSTILKYEDRLMDNGTKGETWQNGKSFTVTGVACGSICMPSSWVLTTWKRKPRTVKESINASSRGCPMPLSVFGLSNGTCHLWQHSSSSQPFILWFTHFIKLFIAFPLSLCCWLKWSQPQVSATIFFGVISLGPWIWYFMFLLRISLLPIELLVLLCCYEMSMFMLNLNFFYY